MSYHIILYHFIQFFITSYLIYSVTIDDLLLSIFVALLAFIFQFFVYLDISTLRTYSQYELHNTFNATKCFCNLDYNTAEQYNALCQQVELYSITTIALHSLLNAVQLCHDDIV